MLLASLRLRLDSVHNPSCMTQKKILPRKAGFSATLLLCWAVGSSAMSLGELEGKALIGKPLELAVAVGFDAAEELGADCFGAEVFHADVRQDPNRVRVQVQSVPQSSTAKVRIVSSIPVDEPVVMVDLHTRCGQSTTRHYVLLADLPSLDEAAPLPVPDTPVPLRSDAPTPPIATVPAAAASSPDSVKPKPSAANRSLAAVKPVQRKASAPKVPVATAGRPATMAAKPAAAVAVKPKLKLDLVDKPAQRLVAPTPLTAASADTPNVAQLEAQNKLLAMQADLKAVRSAAAKTERQLADFKLRLQNAEAERFPAVVVFALLALLLASLGAAAWLWQRQRSARRDAKNWWNSRPMMPAAAVPTAAAPAAAPAVNQAGSTSADKQRPDGAAPSSQIDVSMIGSNFADETDSAPAPAPVPVPVPVPASAPRPVTVKPVIAPAIKGAALPASEPAAAIPNAKPHPAQELNLDLSELEPAAPPASKPAPVPEPPLPTLASDKPEPTDNLIDFDFTDTPKP